MSSKSNDLKEKGNLEYKNGNYREAMSYYSEAIVEDPNNHVLYSNRSICQYNLGNYNDSLNDAKKSLGIKHDFGKGYIRLSQANHKLGNIWDALCSIAIGELYEPTNDAIKKE
jgi:stress-induced-phosphoprotein 1